MLVEIGAKALKIVLNKEDAEELRHPVLHRQIPGQHNGKKQNKTNERQAAEKNFAVAPQHGIRAHHEHCERWSYRPFGQSAHAQQSIKDQKPELLVGLMPCPPA